MIPTVRLMSVSAMSLRWWIKTARGITEQTENPEQPGEMPETSPEAEAVSSGIGLAQTQSPVVTVLRPWYRYIFPRSGGAQWLLMCDVHCSLAPEERHRAYTDAAP